MYKVYKDHADGTYCIESEDKYVWIQAKNSSEYSSPDLGGGISLEALQREGFSDASMDTPNPYELNHDDQIEVLTELDTLDDVIDYIKMTQLLED